MECDERLVELLQALWGLGIKTQWSCQGNRTRRKPRMNDRAYVLCEASPEAERVVQELRQNHPGFAQAYSHNWETGPIPRAVLRRKMFGIERDQNVDDAGPRVCLRFPSDQIDGLLPYLRAVDRGSDLTG